MAFARVAFFPGGTEDQYRAVADELGQAHSQPEGRILLAAGPTESGWEILQVWETEAELRRFAEEDLGPAFGRAGDRAFQAPPEITDFPLHDLITGSA